ncbi:hypothetical protein SAMN05421774_11027 [Gemmobacter megaterium]|uniref:Uncharacterized protein n=1 Tax=Gemmobacter megaterium TaxID=1086013 RepID=A0A1N7QF71_9RHOB|nr:hypothetical protein [Gemmobacter megaterium]GGE25864.1 hypothetical protein GCM10011345_34780 [Gemmobacter megaterium]SIT21512.1 hypothetical protein SAMN05421774_11027 [Gemmobacter megaterium]
MIAQDLPPAHGSASGALVVIGMASPEVHAARVAALRTRPAHVVILDPLIDPSAPGDEGLSGTETTIRLACLPGPRSGTAEITVWSANGLTSLHPPTTALRALFPGLRCRARHDARLETAATLAGALANLPGPVTLWIDAPGSEAAILTMLGDAGLLAQADRVLLRCGVETFFEGAADAATLTARLEDLGFRLEAREEADPDFPELSFGIDQQAQALQDLTGQLTRCEAELAQIRQERDTAQAERTEMAASLARAQAQAAAALAKIEQDLTEARDTRHKMWKDRDRAQAEASGLASQIVALQDEIARLSQEAATARHEATEARTALVAAEAAAKTMAHSLASLEPRAARCDMLEATLAQTRQDLAASRTQNEELAGQVLAMQGRITLLVSETALLDAQVKGQQEEIDTLLASPPPAPDPEPRLREHAAAQAEAAEQARQIARLQTELARHATDLATDQDRPAPPAAPEGQDRLQERIRMLEHRNALANDALRRAEGQVALIRDLLLHDTGAHGPPAEDHSG